MKFKRKLIFAIIFIAATMLVSTKVQAASANISATKNTATAGDSVSINVSVNAATWNLKVSGEGISGDTIVGYDNDGNNTSTSKSFALNTGNPGTYTISLVGDVTDGETEENSLINKSVTVTVEPKSENTDSSTEKQTPEQKPSKSSNANLSNLVVSPVDFKGFKASKTSGYSVTVKNDVTEVGIKATTQDSKAKVEVSGNKNLKVGENTVSIVVTAEDGTKKTYKVTVNREKETSNTEDKEEQVSEPTAEPTSEAIENKDEVLGITSIKLTGIAKNDVTIEPNIVPEFKTDIYEYKVTVPVDIESIEIETKSNIPNANIEVMGNKNLVVGENVITILVKAPEGEQKTYQITVTKTEEPLKIDNNTQLIKNIIIGTIIIILIIAVIISISIFRSGRRNKKTDTVASNINFTDEMLGKDENKNELKENYLDGFENEADNTDGRKKNGKRFK